MKFLFRDDCEVTESVRSSDVAAGLVDNIAQLVPRWPTLHTVGACWARPFRQPSTSPDIWAKMITPGVFRSGLMAGSGSSIQTSSEADAIEPVTAGANGERGAAGRGAAGRGVHHARTLQKRMIVNNASRTTGVSPGHPLSSL
ncbi:hypothetical protein RCH23_001754 [Cryobacterium sp. CAN_C3]|uniref:hypothetical protein n=1 Tax=unclassified Cryobacterium TaxID=2649013 RepID=UPI0018C91C6B|nr:hypothetical protein [Cryobacterium sp. CAN_C3]MEC5154374.1 hypothetical protein [Cryobacterium sp. CAN_C3]